jgi:Flp pilus assembly protein TadG
MERVMKVRSDTRMVGGAHRRGSEVLEAALVFPILIGLAFGTIEFGYWFYVEHNLEAAAAAGARAGIASGLNGDGERYAEATDAAQRVMAASGFTNTSEYDVIPTVVDHNGTEYLQVTLSASWSRIGVKTVGFVRSDKIEAVATMRVED